MRPNKRPRLFEALSRSTPSTGSHNPLDNLLPSLKPSPLRPLDCPVGDRICEWKPESPRNTLDADGYPTNLADNDLAQIRDTIKEAYAPSTRKTYGSGLFLFHVFCDYRDIEERHRAPIDPTILASFISSLVGVYGGGVIRNSVYGVRAWHVIHGLLWAPNANEVEALLIAGQKMAPKDSKKKEKTPWSIEYLADVCNALDKDDPKDAATLACITTAFWGTARLGEVTVPRLDGFDPRIHVKVSDIRRNERDRNNHEQTSFFLPWTKAAKEKGETIFWARQEGIVDPQSALENHLRINNPANDGHLFAFKYKDGARPMTRHILLARINKITTEKDLPKLPGHGIRVGSTVEYLLRGVPFDVVKAKGRWKSDAFKGYLRKHAHIMAQYVQADPGAWDTLVRHTMPPVR